ncbi:MAG TPA: DNA methyltransferase [Kofleriaceae bacterium]
MARLKPELADAELARLCSEFERGGQPIAVSFRTLLANPRAIDRHPHDLHPYPARLLVNIPSFFLSTSLTRPGDLVADPFCGSGTVLVEALLSGRNVVGADSNPLARLITTTKLTPVSRPDALAALARLRDRVRDAPVPSGPFPDVINIDYWFHPHVRRDLLRLLEGIRAMRHPILARFFAMTFSSCVKKVSLADPRLSVPVRLKAKRYNATHWLREKTENNLRKLKVVNVFALFEKSLLSNLSRLAPVSGARSKGGRLHHIATDAREMPLLDHGAVDLIITSPPYLGAQKYIRASSLSLTWLGLCASTELRVLEDLNIGREHFSKASLRSDDTGLPETARLHITRARTMNPLRAHIASTYVREMTAAMREMSRVLRPGGHLVLVVGPSKLCGDAFPTPDVLSEVAEANGMQIRLHLLDTIRSRSLMTRRHATAGQIDTESVLLFKRVNK